MGCWVFRVSIAVKGLLLRVRLLRVEGFGAFGFRGFWVWRFRVEGLGCFGVEALGHKGLKALGP